MEMRGRSELSKGLSGRPLNGSVFRETTTKSVERSFQAEGKVNAKP